MKLESHATPYGGTPQQRYATLHRAIEQGLGSDDLWCELAEVCALLGHEGESRRCVQNITDEGRRQHLVRRISGEKGKSPTGYSAGRRGPTGRGPSGAPAASNAGPARAPAEPAADGGERPGVVEHLADAGQYLFHQQMPWLVLTTMLAFPLVVGVGGFLTAGGSPLLLAAIAALPGLSVLAIVAAMGHEILATSSAGEQDVPDLPEFGRLVRSARDFVLDGLLTFTMFFGAPVFFAVAGAPWTAMLPSVAIGALFAPLAFALRNLRRDMRPFSPVFLVRAMRRCGAGYAAIAATSTLMFVPAFGLTWATMTRPVWVQVAVVGPLCVLPVFAAARLLGSWLDTHRDTLGFLLTGGPGGKGNRRDDKADGKGLDKPKRQRDLRRPEALESFRAPSLKGDVTSRPATARPRTASALRRRPKGKAPVQGRPNARAIEGRRPAARAERAQQAPAQQAPAPRGRRAPAQPAAAGEGPDLSNLPGAYVVSGAERQRRGAAARRG